MRTFKKGQKVIMEGIVAEDGPDFDNEVRVQFVDAHGNEDRAYLSARWLKYGSADPATDPVGTVRLFEGRRLVKIATLYEHDWTHIDRGDLPGPSFSTAESIKDSRVIGYLPEVEA